MRCIFSECLNESTLGVSAGPPGVPPGMGARPDAWRARVRVLRSRLQRTSAALLRNAVDDLVTTAFPADCRACGGPLARATSLPICDACRARIQPQATAMCRICGDALDMEVAMETAQFASRLPSEGLLCSPCRFAPPEFERAVAHAVYRDELREMIHLLKYERMRTVARLLGGPLAEAILMLEGEAAKELVVVPVPLYPAKERQRGYNQSLLLADAAILELKRRRPLWALHLTPALRRRRDTASQFALSPRGRRRNVQGAFAMDPAASLINREVLLIDDIYTTGATARECARVLRRAGARRVWVATVARAQAVRVALWESDGLPHTPLGFG